MGGSSVRSVFLLDCTLFLWRYAANNGCARPRYAAQRGAALRCASLRCTLLRSAEAPLRSATLRCAPLNCATLRSARLRTLRCAPPRSVALSYAPLCCAALRCVTTCGFRQNPTSRPYEISFLAPAPVWHTGTRYNAGRQDTAKTCPAQEA